MFNPWGFLSKGFGGGAGGGTGGGGGTPPEPEIIPTWDVDPFDEIPEAIVEPDPIDVSSPENEFLNGLVVYTPQSSSVYAIQYDQANQTLIVAFGGKAKKPGVTWYGYNPIAPGEALAMFAAGSKGSFVWDNLRRRGTVFGFQRSYFILDGPSTHVPLWHRAGDDSIARHGAIPPAGESFTGYHPATNWASAKGGMGKRRRNG